MLINLFSPSEWSCSVPGWRLWSCLSELLGSLQGLGLSGGVSSSGPGPGQDLAARACPTYQPGAEQLGALVKAHRDGVRPRLSWDMGLWVGPAFHCPWLGKVGLWGAGAWHCCGIAGAGTDGSRELKWDPGPWARLGETWRDWAGSLRVGDALSVLTIFKILVLFLTAAQRLLEGN